MPAPTQQKPRVGGALYTCQFIFLFVVVPYLIGWFLSWSNLDTVKDMMDPWIRSSAPSSEDRRLETVVDFDACFDRVFSAMLQGKPDPFEGLSIVLHRNGESEPCDTTNTNLVEAIKETIETMDHCPAVDQKYPAESFMSRLFARIASKCHSGEKDRSRTLGFYGYCDMGEARTPILPDHDQLLPIRAGDTYYLPCHFHNYYGIRQTNLAAIADQARSLQSCQDEEGETCARPELHLYAVPAGRVFMFAPRHVGEIIPLDHVQGGDPAKQVYLEVLSLSPRVFDLVNFFSRAESKDLVERALQEEKDLYKIKRSSTGASGYNINKHRTSESGYDTSGKTAMNIKRRCFDVLGFDEYVESFSDGLQILRYNLTTAYNKHMDWMELNDRLEHDYDSAGKGGNRFATILLYMTDLGERDGGETVFTEAWPSGQEEGDRVQWKDAIAQLRESGDSKVLEENSWEEEMAAFCRSRLSIRPQAGRSVLFYSQLPNGEEDRSSLHGGCPVLAGTKYAANLWVWNTPRNGYKGHPKNPEYKEKTQEETVQKGLTAQFENKGHDSALANAELYFQDTFWAKLGSGDPPVSVNTFKGHLWRVLVNGKEVRRWTIDANEGTRLFLI